MGLTENAPNVFSDGAQKSTFVNVDFTAGLLAGTVLFSSSERQFGASLSFNNSRITTLGKDMAALWFGNLIVEASLYSTQITTPSGILVIANTSQVTQAFDYFAGSEQNPSILPAEVTVSVSESHLNGDLVAYNGSSVSWSLTRYSTWTGSVYSGYGVSYFGISLDKTSTWVLTTDAYLQNFTNADLTNKNVKSRGHTIFYNSSSSSNVWLNSQTLSLPDGGQLRPFR